MSDENGSFSGDLGKKRKNGLFDYEKSDRFSGVFDTKKHKNVKSKPGYRRIRKNYKSTGKYWEERNRRKQVLQLFSQGFKYKEIALRLGVSERTVKRDMAKIRPYYERLVRNHMRRLGEERRAEIERMLEGKSLLERYKIVQIYNYLNLTMTILTSLPPYHISQ